MKYEGPIILERTFKMRPNGRRKQTGNVMELFAGPPAESVHAIPMCAGNAGRKASAHINVSSDSRAGKHKWEVLAELADTFTGLEIRGGHYRTLSGGRPLPCQDEQVQPAPACKPKEVQLGRRFFPRALVLSPERTVGHTTCPEELPARARKVCDEIEIMDAAPACCPGAGRNPSPFAWGYR